MKRNHKYIKTDKSKLRPLIYYGELFDRKRALADNKRHCVYEYTVINGYGYRNPGDIYIGKGMIESKFRPNSKNIDYYPGSSRDENFIKLIENHPEDLIRRILFLFEIEDDAYQKEFELLDIEDELGCKRWQQSNYINNSPGGKWRGNPELRNKPVIFNYKNNEYKFQTIKETMDYFNIDAATFRSAIDKNNKRFKKCGISLRFETDEDKNKTFNDPCEIKNEIYPLIKEIIKRDKVTLQHCPIIFRYDSNIFLFDTQKHCCDYFKTDYKSTTLEITNNTIVDWLNKKSKSFNNCDMEEFRFLNEDDDVSTMLDPWHHQEMRIAILKKYKLSIMKLHEFPIEIIFANTPSMLFNNYYEGAEYLGISPRTFHGWIYVPEKIPESRNIKSIRVIKELPDLVLD